MRLPAPRSTPPGLDDGVIPMINIVFLLLVFFMIAGTIRPADPIQTEPPVSERQGNASSAARVLHLGADGTLALDGRMLTLGELGDVLSSPVSLPVGVAAGRGERDESGDDEVAPLALRADAAVPFAMLRETIDALRAAGVVRVELIADAATTLSPIVR